MSIQHISRHDFDGYKPARAPMAEAMTEETDWYEDTKGNIIGSVFRDRTDNDWGYVILGRDERGHFRCFDIEACVATEGGARTGLVAAMKVVEASGRTEFRQEDDFVP